MIDDAITITLLQDKNTALHSKLKIAQAQIERLKAALEAAWVFIDQSGVENDREKLRQAHEQATELYDYALRKRAI